MDNLRVVQSEDVVEHVIRVPVWNQVEHLRVTLRVLLLVDQQLTSDHGQDIAVGRSRLCVQRRDSVSDFLEWQGDQFLNNVLRALELSGLEGQHRLLSVQIAQLVSVLVKLLVVEVAELGGNGVEVD